MDHLSKEILPTVKEIQKLSLEIGDYKQGFINSFFRNRLSKLRESYRLVNKKLLEAVIEDGRIFISSTMLDGKFTLRLACLAFRTHLKQIDTLLNVLKEKVKLLEKNV